MTVKLPDKFTFTHDDDVYKAELIPGCEYRITWNDYETGETSYDVWAVRMHIEEGAWKIIENNQ